MGPPPLPRNIHKSIGSLATNKISRDLLFLPLICVQYLKLQSLMPTVVSPSPPFAGYLYFFHPLIFWGKACMFLFFDHSWDPAFPAITSFQWRRMSWSQVASLPRPDL